MSKQGFTLVELIVTIAIIGILMAVGTLYFNQLQRKANIEKEIKELYADLKFVQHQPIVTSMPHRFRFVDANNVVFLRYSSDGDATGTQIIQRSYRYAISKSNWTDPSSNDIDFNTRGLMVDPTIKSICIFSDSNASVDSIVIMQSKINLGRMKNLGGACDAANIDIK